MNTRSAQEFAMSGRYRLVAILTLAPALVVSCESSPDPITRPSVLPSGRIQIVAPPTIDPGATVQLTATLVNPNGSTENVTSRVQWASSNSAVLQVSAAGVATGLERGEATVTARHEQNLPGNAAVMVIPEGTFRLAGQVTEAGFPLGDVRLTVDAGVGQGVTTTTNGNGIYTLYGVAGRVSIAATRQGYLNRIETLDVSQHRLLNIEMVPAGQPVDLAGHYSLALEAEDCASRLPDGARRRVYEAKVDQEGRQLSVRLSGADLLVNDNRGDRFSGVIRGDGLVVFHIGDDFFTYYGYYTTPNPTLVERFNEASVLVVIGDVSAKGSTAGISGTLAGSIGLVQRTAPPFWPFSVVCHSSRHRFEMQRITS
jgi:hypothetical protein